MRQFSIWKLLGAGFAFLLSFNCFGFALMGPYEDWMQYSNGFKFPGDIGGPMELHSEYRWNVPVITYGFDQSFMDFFGEEGVAAVKDAMHIFNALPAASQINLSKYSNDTRRVNITMAQRAVCDLKSETLHLLIERLGLASPARNILVVRQSDPGFFPPFYPRCCPWRWPDEWEDWYDIYFPRRNYDPDTLETIYVVNNFPYNEVLQKLGDGRLICWPVAYDPTRASMSAVAEDGQLGGSLYAGLFYTGLTRDDVGGIKYLLNATNINYEFLLPDVRGRGGNAQSWVNGAWRPGVEKITFKAQSYDSSHAKWRPMVLRYTDTYFTETGVKHQKLERVITQPDILFSAGNNGKGETYSLDAFRGDASQWQNNAVVNGNTNGTGPGIILPPTIIRFQKLGLTCSTSSSGGGGDIIPWGRIDITNRPTVFPVASYSGRNQLEVNLFLSRNYTNFGSITWTQAVPAAAQLVLQRSANGLTWSSLTVISNQGGILDWRHDGFERQEFFRIIPAP